MGIFIALILFCLGIYLVAKAPEARKEARKIRFDNTNQNGILIAENFEQLERIRRKINALETKANYQTNLGGWAIVISIFLFFIFK